MKTLSNSAGLCQIDMLRWGPLRSTWCMMFEHMNQVVKFSALRNNFLNTLKTTGTRLAETLAFNLFSKRQADFSKPVIFVQLEEMCSLGSSPIVDLLIVCQWLKPRLCANKLPIHPAFVSPWPQSSGRVLLPTPLLTMKVEWLWKIKIGNYSYQVGDHVLCSAGTSRCIATIVSLLHIDGRSYLQLVRRRRHSNHRASARTSKLTLVCVPAAAVPGGGRSAGPSTTLNLMGHSQGCGVCPPRALRIC